MAAKSVKKIYYFYQTLLQFISTNMNRTITYLFLVSFILTLTSCNSQNKIIVVKGSAFCPEQPNFVSDVPVYLRLNDSIYLTERTNSTGQYLFKIDKQTVPVSICIEGIRQNKLWQKENTGYRTCSEPKTVILKGDTIEVEEFYLSPYQVMDYGPQYVRFKFNSLTTVREKNIVPFTDLPADSAISEIITMLNDNPTVIIELSGHCDINELNPTKLSQQRAQLVADKLIKRGVPKERLSPKGFGVEKLLISTETINKLKPSEREAKHQLNRRVVFKILSFDYKGGK